MIRPLFGLEQSLNASLCWRWAESLLGRLIVRMRFSARRRGSCNCHRRTKKEGQKQAQITTNKMQEEHAYCHNEKEAVGSMRQISDTSHGAQSNLVANESLVARRDVLARSCQPSFPSELSFSFLVWTKVSLEQLPSARPQSRI